MSSASEFAPVTPIIAISGGTGTVGQEVVRGLLSAGAKIRLLTRDAAGAQRQFPDAEALEVDFAKPETLRSALSGAGRLFLAQGSNPAQVENEIALIDAAVATEIPYLVKLSSLGGPSARHPLDWQARIESHLAVQPLGYTVLRPSAFVDVLRHAGPFVKSSTWGGVAGGGQVSYIDTRDLAAVAVHDLLHVADESAQRSRHLSGGRAWTMPEIASELSRLLGRTIGYTPRTLGEQLQALEAAGLNPAHAQILVGLDRLFRDGMCADVTTTVREVLHREPRTVTDWLTENLDTFR